MKYFLSLTLLLVSCASIPTKADQQDPTVVNEVDLNKYAGKWYEIARYPTFFQRNCVYSTAEYAVASPDSISVHNVCHKENRETSDIKGTAKIVDSAVPAKLKVVFNIFARGDYWIIGLDPNYQWAVVSGPRKESLFVLARTAPMEPQLLSSIISDLKKRGFDTEKIVYDRYE